MSFDKLSAILKTPTEIGSTSSIGPGKVKDAGGANFDELVFKGLDSVNQEIVTADKVSQEYLTEGKHDLHEVMIALEKADMSFRFINQVRNKVLDAYNEVMRLQV